MKEFRDFCNADLQNYPQVDMIFSSSSITELIKIMHPFSNSLVYKFY